MSHKIGGPAMYENIRFETERLVIRSFTENDLNHLNRIVNDKKIMSNVPFAEERTLDECKALLGRILSRYGESTSDEFKGFLLLVELKENSEQIGTVGLFPLTYNAIETEIFYGLFEEYYGMGYATEIGKSIIKYALYDMSISKVVATVNEKNTHSKRVLEKLGMKFEYIINDTDGSSYDGEQMYSVCKIG